jgi:hypothetical protein
METIDHILSKMREPSCFKGKIPVGRVDADFRYFADRIETVVKALVADRDNWRRQALAEDAMENAVICENSLQVGNAAKMREALSDACYAMFNFLKTQYGCRYEEMAKALDKAKAALAEPPRNCDVGTAEEQSVRMSKFCSEQYEKSDGVMLCSGCRFHDIEGLECQFAWSQMPYESEVK